jgi:hypothetical protein
MNNIMTTSSAPTTSGHCPNCNCSDCTEYFENERIKAVRKEQFDLWNWNLSAAEVAEAISELEDTDPAWEDRDEILDHLSHYFDKETAWAVEDCLNTFF